jgi:hypothetical protein
LVPAGPLKAWMTSDRSSCSDRRRTPEAPVVRPDEECR